MAEKSVMMPEGYVPSKSIMRPKTISDEAKDIGKEMLGGIAGEMFGGFQKGVGQGTSNLAMSLLQPLSMYSPDAEGAGSGQLKMAKRLAELFSDWWKHGDINVNVHRKDLPRIINSRKLMNQMEFTGSPDAWVDRIVHEKNLGIPYPYQAHSKKRIEYINARKPLLKEYNELLRDSETKYYDNPSGQKLFWEKIGNVEKRMGELDDAFGKSSPLEAGLGTQLNPFTPQEARRRPVYGHVYNPNYQEESTARYFGGNAHLISDSPAVREQSKYVLGDSFDPLVRQAFTADDMAGKTSALERALFNSTPQMDFTTTELKHMITDDVPYMEALIPNNLATINNFGRVAIRRPIGNVPPGEFTPKGLRQLFENINPQFDGRFEQGIGDFGISTPKATHTIDPWAEY
jgi:hypothetical protein